MLRKLLFCVAMLVIAGPAAADDTARCAREAHDVAIAACTRAINSGAGRPSINYSYRGLAYREKGETDRAIADYTEAIRLDPKHAEAHVNRGQAYSLKREGTDRAIADFTEAIRLDPKLAHAYFSRGLAYEKLADFARARSDYDTTLALSQERSEWLQDRARARLAALAAFPSLPTAWPPVATTWSPAATASPPPATASPEKSNVTTAITPTAPVMKSDRRIALVIGNFTYENATTLRNPERDANLVADVLKRTGFETVTCGGASTRCLAGR